MRPSLREAKALSSLRLAEDWLVARRMQHHTEVRLQAHGGTTRTTARTVKQRVHVRQGPCLGFATNRDIVQLRPASRTALTLCPLIVRVKADNTLRIRCIPTRGATQASQHGVELVTSTLALRQDTRSAATTVAALWTVQQPCQLCTCRALDRRTAWG